MYGVDDLIRIASDANLKVSAVQIGEWHRAGLLPDTVQPPGPRRRGRPRLFFPEPAPRSVCSLARWRRSVNGDENARGWLWLEGFDYIEIDPDKEFAAWLDREWTEYRKTCPPLPETPKTPVDPERREAILEELDANYTKPESEKHGIPAEWFATHPALLGLFSEEEWQKLEEYGVGRYDDNSDRSSPNPLLAGVHEAGQYMFGDLPYDRGEMLAGPANAPALLAAVGLPGLARGSIDWPCARAMWQFVCIATNVYDAPELAEQPAFHQWRAVGGLLRKVRYHAYSHFEPWFVAAILAAVCKIIPERQRRELIHAVEYFRREQSQTKATAGE